MRRSIIETQEPVQQMRKHLISKRFTSDDTPNLFIYKPFTIIDTVRVPFVIFSKQFFDIYILSYFELYLSMSDFRITTDERSSVHSSFEYYDFPPKLKYVLKSKKEVYFF